MAIAGLHSVPTLESSMFRESQSSSSRRHGSQGNISTRASSILQMWRELEDECAVNRARERVTPRFNREGNDSSISPRGGSTRGDLGNFSESENGSVINPESQIGQMNDLEDRQSMTSEQSLDLGDIERERVRKIFREWMSSGENVETPRVARINRSSRGQCGGENEMERVRVVSNWVQTTSHSRGACVWSREDQVSENVSEVEQVHNGEVFNPNEGQIVTSRRQIRKLYGRQALLDLLAKKEQERRLELQCLEGTRPVSSFAHRNRIQSLLRLRCFQNRRSTEARRPTSPAESELGLLRQRQTVSGLREGFLSRLDNNAHVQASDMSVSSSENNPDAFRDDQSQANSAIEVLVVNELNIPLTEVLTVTHEENDLRDDVDVAPPTAPPTAPPNIDPGVGSLANLDHLQGRLEHDGDNSVISDDFSNDRIQHLSLQESPRTESGQFTALGEGHESTHEQYSDIEDPNFQNELEDQVDLLVNGNSHESDVPEEEEQVYEREWGSPFSDRWRDDQVESDRLDLLGDGEDHFRAGLESEGGEQIDMEEDYWHDNGSQETPRDWLGMDSGSRSASNRVDSYYFSDDDNVHHIELRELVNRRRVSSLLHSDFRESLDQIIQSYVERQANVPDDWELHEMLPPPLMSRNQAHLHTDQNDSHPNDSRANRNEPPPPPPLPQGHWGQGMHQSNRTRREMRQRPEMEWEIINDLRVDMARLQQRLNNMQRMLETCMDMQIELQRSMKQEVSAALSRSLNSSESLESSLPKDNLKWDTVRKGVCCVCSNTNIDSLLYRCGHMCTCTKCAEILVQDNGKCPMCQAPVIEVIRAYFIQ